MVVVKCPYCGDGFVNHDDKLEDIKEQARIFFKNHKEKYKCSQHLEPTVRDGG